jgi:hypothetical protein
MDCAHGEPIGGEMHVSSAGFAHMTRLLQQVMPHGRVVLALEGGYNVNAIAQATCACVEVLLGDELPTLPRKDWFVDPEQFSEAKHDEEGDDNDDEADPPETFASFQARVAHNRRIFARELQDVIAYQQRHWNCLKSKA